MPHDARRAPAPSPSSSPSRDGPAELRIDRSTRHNRASTAPPQPAGFFVSDQSVHTTCTLATLVARGCTAKYLKMDGLVPAVIQDAESGEVLMVGFMNDTALAEDERDRDLRRSTAGRARSCG